MKKTYLMTLQTQNRLKTEIKELKEKMKSIQLDMGDAARNNPDLRENFAYMECDKELDYLYSRIKVIKEKISYSKIIKFKFNAKKIEIGVTFKIMYLDTNDIYKHTLLGEDDALTKPYRWISYKSLLGKTLLGGCTGSKTELVLPYSSKVVKVIKIY